jgi:hypothetical protein
VPAPGQRNHQRKEQPGQNADSEGCAFHEFDVQEVEAESDQTECDCNGHPTGARLQVAHDRPLFPGIVFPSIVRERGANFIFVLLATNAKDHWRGWSGSGIAVQCSALCTPGMGVNLWGESPLYVNPVNVFNILTKVLAEGKGVSVRKGLKGWSEA